MDRVIPPKYVNDILSRLESRGFSAYMVGGCVRDLIMGRRPHDWDICTSALPNEVLAVFPHCIPTGIKHGTVTVKLHDSTAEITTFRSDGEYTDHRRPEAVSFLTGLKGDLERRDFTANALALARSGELCDLFGGRNDIEKRLIRCVGEPDRRFKEDALRMFRAFRFCAVLGFEIEPYTLAAIRRNAPLSAFLAKERIRDELEKILLSDSPQTTSCVIEYGLISDLIDDASALPELLALKRLPKNRARRWAALCALLLNSGVIKDAAGFLTLLRLDSASIRICSSGAKLALDRAPHDALSWKKLLAENGEEIASCAAAACDALYGSGHRALLRSVLKSGECWSIKQLAVTGDDLTKLGFRGVEVGSVLSLLLSHVLEIPSDNDRTLLLNMARELAAARGKHSS